MNIAADYTTPLKLTGFTSMGDAAFSNNLGTFGGLAASNSNIGNTFTASLNTANYTTSGTSTIAISAAQLVDDSVLPGAGSNNNGGVTVTLVGNVGNATADASNSTSNFGTALTAIVPSGGSYANLESTVRSTTGSGGNRAVGTTATLLAGTNINAASQSVSMQWRTRTTGAEASFASDVLDVSGLSLDGLATGQTAPFVLQMSYDASRFGADEAMLAIDGRIDLLSLDLTSGLWRNAIDDNFGINEGEFHDAAWQSGDLTLGDWGVNTANHTVWAVLNHNSQFAVVPEPGTLGMLAVSAIGILWCIRRQRRCRNIGTHE
jgi:hypothetical protein